jgi:hypothetical protein
MQLAIIMMISKRKLVGLILLALPFISFCQENSPYSRYGIGNLAPQGNIVNRGLGGISAGFSDPAAINFNNPASYADLKLLTFDIAIQVDSRTLVQQNPIDKFTSNNATVPYLQLGIPLFNPAFHPTKKAAKKGFSWAANIGLRPISRINYQIETLSRISDIDSLSTVYEGSGGLNQAFLGTGMKIKNFAFGFNIGYTFGSKNYATRLEFINDTVNYIKSNSATNTQIGGVFINAGVQYTSQLKNKMLLKVGAYGNLSQNYNATQQVIRESFVYNSSGGTSPLDSVYKISQDGKIKIPASFGIGFTVQDEHILTGLDFETTSWSNYRYFGQTDLVTNSWLLKGGFQYYPGKGNKYLGHVRYRTGLYYGKDYINADKDLQEIGITAGIGLPLQRPAYYGDRRLAMLNLAVEYGSRGSKTNNLRENIFRISAGFSLNDLWFKRYKYD